MKVGDFSFVNDRSKTYRLVMVRFKARYILCEVLYQNGEQPREKLTDFNLLNAVKRVLKDLHGDYGMSYTLRSQCLRVQYLNNATNMAMIKCKRGFHKLVQSSLPFLKRINNEEMMLRTLHLSGTIRSCNKFILKHHKAKLPRLLQDVSDPEERKKVEALVAESCQECEHKLRLLEPRVT